MIQHGTDETTETTGNGGVTDGTRPGGAAGAGARAGGGRGAPSSEIGGGGEDKIYPLGPGAVTVLVAVRRLHRTALWLAGALGVDRPTVLELLAELEDKNLVAYRPGLRSHATWVITSAGENWLTRAEESGLRPGK